MNKIKAFWMLSMFILVVPIVFAEDVAIDGFESSTFCGGTGWEDCWSKSGSASIQFHTAYEGTRFVYMQGTETTISREVNVSAYNEVNISFWVRVENMYTTDETKFLINDVEYENWVDGDDDNTWKYYSYVITPTTDIIELKFYLQSAVWNTFDVDYVKVEGQVEEVKEVIITMDNNYPKGMTNVPIDLSSSESSTLHTLNLSYSNGTQFCYKQLQSPSTPYTTFTAYCDMPDDVSIDNKAYLYLTNDESVNTTDYFNIIELDNNPDELNIEQVYYSPQVIQGSSTEIFAIIDGVFNSTKLYLEFPDNSIRILNMQSTGNVNEYRAFITDTFQTGNVSFMIRAESESYYDEYVSEYTVIPYNLDFVDIVNRVGEVLQVKFQTPDADVLGTYYEVGDQAKVIAQLSAQGEPINNATCYASIYYPDDSILVRHTYMRYIEDSDGLYVYDITAPDYVGVYPISVVCDYQTYESEYFIENFELVNGTVINGTITSTYYDDDDEIHLISQVVDDDSYLEMNFDYNISTDYQNNSELIVYWEGLCDKEGAEGFMYWYNVNTDTWDKSTNSITHELTEASFETPSGNLTDYVNSTGWVNLKFNGTAPVSYTTETIFSDDFEDGTLSPWIEVEFAPPYTATVSSSGELNGTYSMILYGSSSGGDESGASYVELNTTGYENITISYTREVEGYEISENEYWQVIVSYDGGSNWETLEDGFGNTAESRQTYNLNSSYDDNENVILEFYTEVDYDNDELRVDDVLVTGQVSLGGGFYTDMLVLRNIGVAGVVQNVRGGGEFNVKDRLDDIETDINDLVTYSGLTTNTISDLSVTNYNSNETILFTNRLTYEINSSRMEENNAECSLSLYTNHNTTSIGDVVVTEQNMTYQGNGIYLYGYEPTQDGIYTVEINCEKDDRNYYDLHQFRVGLTVNVQGDVQAIVSNIDDISSAIDALTELELYGTDYEVGDNGRTFLTIEEDDEYINNATCKVTIDYPQSVSTDYDYFVNDAYMQAMGRDGLYYYDFIAPNITGIYMISATCDLLVVESEENISSENLVEGDVDDGSVSDTYADDGSYYELEEDFISGDYKYNHVFTYDFSGVSDYNSTSATLYINFVGYNDIDFFDESESILIQIQNQSDSSWNTLDNSIPSQLNKGDDISVGNTLSGSPDYFDGSGNLKIRLYDSDRTSDSDMNEIDIDLLNVGVSIPTQVPVEVKRGGGELNIRRHFTDLNSSIFDDMDDLLSNLTTQLDSVKNKQNRQEHFADEQIYLITDAITALDGIKQDVASGMLSKSEAENIINDMKENLMNEQNHYNNPLQGSPNEIYINYKNGKCITTIKNEGTKIGNYDLALSVIGYESKVVSLRLEPGEVNRIPISLMELPQGKYECKAVSQYNGGKQSLASLQVEHNPSKEIKTTTNFVNKEQTTNNKFDIMPFLMIFVVMGLLVANIKTQKSYESKEVQK